MIQNELRRPPAAFDGVPIVHPVLQGAAPHAAPPHTRGTPYRTPPVGGLPLLRTLGMGRSVVALQVGLRAGRFNLASRAMLVHRRIPNTDLTVTAGLVGVLRRTQTFLRRVRCSRFPDRVGRHGTAALHLVVLARSAIHGTGTASVRNELTCC